MSKLNKEQLKEKSAANFKFLLSVDFFPEDEAEEAMELVEELFKGWENIDNLEYLLKSSIYLIDSVKIIIKNKSKAILYVKDDDRYLRKYAKKMIKPTNRRT